MVANSIGVRELKLHAPKLVRQASRGQRIVITRYGKPLAVLGPALEGATRTKRALDWEKEERAFLKMRPRLERRFGGSHVAIRHGKVIDSDPDAEALFQRVWRKLGGATFFIGAVQTDTRTVELPSFTLA